MAHFFEADWIARNNACAQARASSHAACSALFGKSLETHDYFRRARALLRTYLIDLTADSFSQPRSTFAMKSRASEK